MSSVETVGEFAEDLIGERLLGTDAIKNIDDLLNAISERMDGEQLRLVSQAYHHAEVAHEGQFRRSGEAYINHPLAVAAVVASMNLDHTSVMCALLHDVLEDTPTTKEILVGEFGEDIADIVDGLSKLNHLEFKSKEEAQAESFRKMLLAMVSDIRVILIKLADRLHNMRTLDAMSAEKQVRISRETLEVYAPIAHRLGMFSIKNELEDLAFQYVYPMRYRTLRKKVDEARYNRFDVISKLEKQLNSSLDQADIESVVTGREKNLYSLYKKKRDKQLTFQEVFDVFAIRIIVDSVDDCYRALGICHGLYKPMPRKFKDYIAVPKQNNYQSLHTVLTYSDGIPVEVQIRTREMDEYASSGIAAHWIYKEDDASSKGRKAHHWLNSLVDMQQNTRDVHEFIENVKVDLFPGEIYVFTPKGRIIQLPANATPVDFAYAVHSDIGSTCVTAKVDRKLAALSTQLESGQTVEIITASTSTPSPLWLNFVVTAKARTAIRHHLRNLDRVKASDFGHRLISRALTRYDMDLEDISDKNMKLLLSEFHFTELNELFIDVGMGNHLPSLIAARLVQKQEGVRRAGDIFLKDTSPLLIEGAEGSVLTLSKCCRPLPGDDVVGLITPGRGIAVHRIGCRSLTRALKQSKEAVAVGWSDGIEDDFEAVIAVWLVNQPGSLARVTTVLSSMNANIEGVEFNNRGESEIIIHFLIKIRDRKHLARIIRRVRNLAVVTSVKRDQSGKS